MKKCKEETIGIFSKCETFSEHQGTCEEEEEEEQIFSSEAASGEETSRPCSQCRCQQCRSVESTVGGSYGAVAKIQ